VVHKFQERISFKNQLKNAGIKWNDKFDFTEESFHNVINAVEEIKQLAIKTENKISGYEFNESLYDQNGIETKGIVQMQKDNSFKVYFSMSKIKTNLDFVYTFGHELTHIVNYGNMSYKTYNSQTKLQMYQEEINTWTNFNKFYGDPNAQKAINYYQSLLNK
jgi:hypothetical protein